MKAVFQTKFGGSDAREEEQGNCMAACLASVFEIDLDDVPDFGGKIADGRWYNILVEWLAKRGLGFIQVLPTAVFDLPGFHLQARKSTTLPNPDDGHMVVVKNTVVVHDPNPKATELGGPEEYWVFVPLDAGRWRERER